MFSRSTTRKWGFSEAKKDVNTKYVGNKGIPDAMHTALGVASGKRVFPTPQACVGQTMLGKGEERNEEPSPFVACRRPFRRRCRSVAVCHLRKSNVSLGRLNDYVYVTFEIALRTEEESGEGGSQQSQEIEVGERAAALLTAFGGEEIFGVLSIRRRGSAVGYLVEQWLFYISVSDSVCEIITGEVKESKAMKNKVDLDNHDDASWWLIQKGVKVIFLSISLFALLIRVAVSLHPYSGAGNSPKYGDYEAQRHWMEITINLPAKDWYRNSTTNDLNYWGLDYPPLTAYQSFVHGLLLKLFVPDSVSLFTSRGYESYFGKLLMRWTVLSSDVLIFFPAVFYFVLAYFSDNSRFRKRDIAWQIAILLINPCLILIDHGHFQYNCISLGLTVGAIAAICTDKDLVGSFLFTLALNHKQGALPKLYCLEDGPPEWPLKFCLLDTLGVYLFWSRPLKPLTEGTHLLGSTTDLGPSMLCYAGKVVSTNWEKLVHFAIAIPGVQISCRKPLSNLLHLAQ
ncbi:putative dolichyl pyrophosphate Man9GlcNAc2 alpha-1,3-glucosyltransferase [Cucumis melo var. makuwa]|uniref:Alpha-1,3-glucosyltransferase n=1 Tax=Cucumis melo var. makuwa TaxID=1194695 RepID=A0A5D3CML7_CUCMM|nr:putative dolichyl pyrophosphate Man9GlcNAc2 alpha-1,3-glucosyltransferase [Cucumis melo var. makuwa]